MGDQGGLKVGLFFSARPEQGGLYQYALTVVHCLHAYEARHQYILFHAALAPLLATPTTGRWRVVRLAPPAIRLHQLIAGAIQVAAQHGWRWPVPILPQFSAIRRTPVDLMVYVQPTVCSFLWPYPFVFPIHDLQHLFQPEFPEVSAGGERSRREFIFRNSAGRALGILADSEVGREDVIRAYGVDPGRVYALPYVAPTYLASPGQAADLARVRERYQLPPDFLFYPAAFWPHKNHARLLKAVRLLKVQHSIRLPLVLAGGRSREYEKLARLAAELDISDQVQFLGYVPDEDMYPLYRLALALVMPTFFGPTNIPILEAWAQGCPVITSDLRGIREQVGDAGLLVDPRDEQSIAGAIRQVCDSRTLRDDLIEKGRRRVAAWTPQDFATRLGSILSECGQAVSR